MNNTGKGLIAYLLGWIGALIVLFGIKDNDRNITFHCYQSIMIDISMVAVSLVVGMVGLFIPFIGLISTAYIVFCFVLIILGVIKVCNNEPDPKLVLIGDLTEKVFGDAINKAPVTVAPAANVTPSFDPNTGQPINRPEPKFDPNTGQPINPPEAKFDPNTGEPINKTEPAPEPEATPETETAPAEAEAPKEETPEEPKAE